MIDLNIRSTIAIFSTLLPLLSACGQTSAPAPSSAASSIQMTDITAQTGLDFKMTCGALPAREILEVNGGGLALIDFDNDNDLDLFVANGATLADVEHGPGSKLFENLGGFKFQDVTDRVQINVHRWAMGAAVGDYDGDGFDDIYVTCFGPDILLRNTGQDAFEDVTATARISDSRWGTSAAFGDLDADGDLDLYVANYLVFDPKNPPARTKYKGADVMGGPHGMTPEHDTVYENLGNGTFRDVTSEAGCLPKAPAFGLNVVILDFDQDGKQDIAVANDSMPDFFFHNISEAGGKMKFEEIGVISGMAANADGSIQASMGLAIADVDGNGLPDKFTSVFSSDTNSMHMNMDGRLFEDRSAKYGLGSISRPYLGWGCGFYDFDHDADEDLFVVNGHVYPEATLASMDSEYAQPPLLFERVGNRFQRVKGQGPNAWLSEKGHNRNVVFDDFDADGDIDMIIGTLNGPLRVLRNDRMERLAEKNDNWLIVELRDDRPGCKNRKGLGSRIELSAKNATGQPISMNRWLFTGAGFQSSGAPSVHFCLPKDAHEPVINITWPGGERQTVTDIQLRQRVTLSRQPS